MSIIAVIVGILVAALISGFVIWVVGKLGLGLTVSGYGQRCAYRSSNNSAVHSNGMS
ncbi:MAG: hypothetical protein HGB05_16275 [Chloroflexi bacterium]|jgi:type IV secretory pathway TrbD component|nr:hypothetical protein [Chloroflexota bacterium]